VWPDHKNIDSHARALEPIFFLKRDIQCNILFVYIKSIYISEYRRRVSMCMKVKPRFAWLGPKELRQTTRSGSSGDIHMATKTWFLTEITNGCGF
jgi:hypothetical protein